MDLTKMFVHVQKSMKELDLSVLGSNFNVIDGPSFVHKDGSTCFCISRKFYTLEDIRKELNSGNGEYYLWKLFELPEYNSKGKEGKAFYILRFVVHREEKK